MTLLFGRLRFNDLTKVPKRYKNGPNHWSTLRKKVAPTDKALKHFDDFYKTVYGASWSNIREALLKTRNKHIALVNNFGDTNKTIETLEAMGAINMRSIYEAQKNLSLQTENAKAKKQVEEEKKPNVGKTMKDVLDDKQSAEVRAVYPAEYEPLQSSLEEASEVNVHPKLDAPLAPVVMRSIDEDVASAKQDESRIIKSSMSLTSATIHEFIPATKIKGLDGWLLESDHYGYYNQGADFSVAVKKDSVLNFPEHLKIYTFEAHNSSRFSSPQRGDVDVFNYYLMDGASILPVLALDLQPGDTVLDMCAAPGGKSLAVLQTLMPRVLVANDVKLNRMNRINSVIDEYIGDLDLWENRLFITNKDGREMQEVNVYNKILVDVPCTTDRHVLHEDDNNIFKASRLEERLQQPELQSQLLSHALTMIAPGGTVVYSTCTLSPIQNDGVVQMALKSAWETTQSMMVVIDMMEALAPLRCLYKFGNIGLKYGHIVIPTKANNWGPMYFCKIMRQH